MEENDCRDSSLCKTSASMPSQQVTMSLHDDLNSFKARQCLLHIAIFPLTTSHSRYHSLQLLQVGGTARFHISVTKQRSSRKGVSAAEEGILDSTWCR